MTIRDEDVATVARGGGEVRTTSGDKIGNIGQIYLDDESGHPSWVTVKTGLFGTQESFVPLGRADVDGVDVVVPYDKQTIKDAPRVETGGSLTPQEEKRLFAYYFDAQTIDTGPDRDRDLDRDRDDGWTSIATTSIGIRTSTGTRTSTATRTLTDRTGSSIGSEAMMIGRATTGAEDDRSTR